MRNIFAIIIGMLVFTGFTACDKTYDGKTAYELYELANEKSNSVKSMTVSMNGVIGIDINNLSMDTKIDGVVKMIIRSETDFDMKMDIITSVMGEQHEMNAYYIDGFMYMDLYGMKMKIPLDAEKAAEMSYSQSLAFPESAVYKQSAKSEGEDIRISFTLRGDALNEILAPIINNLTESMGTDDINIININDIYYKSLLAKDYTIKNYRMVFDAEMSSNTLGGNFKMSYDITAYISDIDSTIIIMPDDIDEYTDIESGFSF